MNSIDNLKAYIAALPLRPLKKGDLIGTLIGILIFAGIDTYHLYYDGFAIFRESLITVHCLCVIVAVMCCVIYQIERKEVHFFTTGTILGALGVTCGCVSIAQIVMDCVSYAGLYIVGYVVCIGFMVYEILKNAKRRINTEWYKKRYEDTDGIIISSVVFVLAEIIVLVLKFKRFMDGRNLIILILCLILSYILIGVSIPSILRGYYIKKYHLQEAVVVEIPKKENDKQEESQEESPNSGSEHKK